jgi:hypothetical protein
MSAAWTGGGQCLHPVILSAQNIDGVYQMAFVDVEWQPLASDMRLK